MIIKVKILKGSVNGCKNGDVIDIDKALIESLAVDNNELKFEEVIEDAKPKRGRKKADK